MVFGVIVVALMLGFAPMVLAENTEGGMETVPFSRSEGEPADFSQEDGDGIIEPGETA